jgi:branched-chain amino acid transport system permease protein
MDMRNYLSALSPDVVNYFAFNQTPINGGLLYLVIFLAGAFVGWLLNHLFLHSKGLREYWSAISNSPIMRSVLSNKWFRYGLYAVLAILCFIMPREWGSYWNYVLSVVGIYVILGLGLNIIVGLSGQLVLGYVGFFAIGAYTMALLNAPKPHNLMWGFWIALPIGVVLAALTGVLIGLPIMRLRGDYLAIVTLGFGEIIRILLRSDLLTDFTGGPRGIQDIKGPVIFGQPFDTDIDFMYLIILAVLLSIFVASRLKNSRVGRSWLSIREDETVARASGVNTVIYKLLALALGAALAGLGGGIFAAKTQFTGPGDHDLMVSINVLSIVIVGGLGSLPGIVLGAFALKGLPEILREIATYRLLAFGMLLVVMMILRPQGLLPVAKKELEHKAVELKAKIYGSPGGDISEVKPLEEKHE